MKTQEITVEGKKAMGFWVDLPGAPLVLARGSKGFVMCGFLDLHSADRLNAPAAIVRGVSSVDELLAKPVVAVTAAAAALGVKAGMSGYEALDLLS